MKKIINPWEDLTDKGYNCFACAKSNPWGLKMDFWEDGDDVVSLWRPDDNYQGWLKTLHGGIQATLMDEIGGWYISRKLQLSAMTTNLNIKYRKPVPTGQQHQLEIRARLKEQKRNFVTLSTSLLLGGELLSSAEITYYCFSEEVSREKFHFRGCRVEGE